MFWVSNINLTNGLCLIHPFLVYLVYIYLLLYSFKKYNIFYYWFILNNIKKALYINFFALILGSWWAYQELNWGGWWNWDFVELILFIFFIKLIIINHNLKFLTSLYLFLYNFVFFFYLIIFFVFVRWDILNSIHSFNLVSVFENYINYIGFLVLIFLIAYVIHLNWVYIKIKKNNCYIKTIYKLTYTNISLNFFIIIIILFFFFSVWLTISYQTEQNETVFFLKFFLILIVFLASLNFNQKNFYYIYSLTFTLKNFINVIFFLNLTHFIFKKITWNIKKLHILILISFLVYLYLYDFQFFNKIYTNYLLSNLIFSIKNNLVFNLSDFFVNINISNNFSSFNSNLLNNISFFNVYSDLLSFSAITQFDYFYLKTYNYLLIVFWFFIFFFFIYILLLFNSIKKHLNNIY